MLGEVPGSTKVCRYSFDYSRRLIHIQRAPVYGHVTRTLQPNLKKAFSKSNHGSPAFHSVGDLPLNDGLVLYQ
jgi:hypothetical protein